MRTGACLLLSARRQENILLSGESCARASPAAAVGDGLTELQDSLLQGLKPEGLRKGNRAFGHPWTHDIVTARLDLPVLGRAMCAYRRESYIVDTIDGKEGAPCGRETAADLPQIVLDVERQHMGEDREGENKVEAGIGERKAILHSAITPAGIIVIIVDVRMHETEVGIVAIGLPAPGHCLGDDLQADILSRAQDARQG
jgi:hypothetical protein